MSAGAEDGRSSSPGLVIGDSGAPERTDGGATTRAGPSGDHPQLESPCRHTANRRRVDGVAEERLQAVVSSGAPPPPDEEPSPFQRLPRELQLLVFSHLSPRKLCTSVMPVCRQWYELGRDPVLWQHLSFDGRTCSGGNVINVLSFSTLLKTLTLDRWGPVDKVLLQVADTCPQLRSLTVTHCDGLDSRTMEAIVKKCPLIERVNFERLQFDSCNCMSALTGLQHLKALDLLFCRPPSGAALVPIARHCTSLQELNVDNLTDVVVQELVAHAGDRLLSFKWEGVDLPDAAFEAMCRCRKLQTLWILGAYSLTDVSLTALAGLHGLTRLEIRDGDKLSSAALARLFAGQSLPLLVHLSLCGCSKVDDTTVDALTAKYPQLIHLNLSWCEEITGVGIKRIVTRLHCLRALELCGCIEVCVGDETLDLLTTNCLQLTALDLNWCGYISDAGIKLINSRLHCLRWLDLLRPDDTDPLDDFERLHNLPE